jgi:hypothetical protein
MHPSVHLGKSMNPSIKVRLLALLLSLFLTLGVFESIAAYAYQVIAA